MLASGANALSVAPDQTPMVKPAPAAKAPPRAARAISMDAARTLDALPRPRVTGVQPSLFGTELQPKIIPFDKVARHAQPRVETPSVSQASRPASRSAARKSRTVDESQATLDFLQPGTNTPKVLKTSAEAVIYCDAVAAAPMHRSAAAALDAAMVLVGFGIILAIFQFAAKPVGLNRNAFLMLGGMLVLTAMFYSLLFAISGALTPGMRWTELRLINFDGFPPDPRSRAFRLIGGWISILSGGLGLVWALLDEEGLTWHDHMSKTFPTIRESNSIVVRHNSR